MNERQYKANLAEIEVRNPGEPLLPALRRGFSPVNVLYMNAARRRMPTVLDDHDDDGDDLLPAPAASATTRPVPDDLRRLWAERTRLFGEMNKQSNAFHACKTDAERAENSRSVLAWWAQILAIKGRIEYFEQNGEHAPVAQEEEEPLPDNAALLSQKLASIRARISQTKKKLSELAGLDPSTPNLAQKIEAQEQRLSSLKNLAGKAEQKLKSYAAEA